MGTGIEVNDTLQLTVEQGFPHELFDREKHLANPLQIDDLADRIFEFHDKEDARIFHLDPVRVYFVHNIDGKWLFWGRVLIQSQTISKRLEADGSWKKGSWMTSGTFKVIDIYNPDYQKLFTMNESPAGKSYFT